MVCVFKHIPFLQEKVKDKAPLKKLADVVEKPDKVNDKATVKKPADVVEKPDKVKDKATVKKPADVVEKPFTVVVKDQALLVNGKNKEKETVKDKATVKKSADVMEKPSTVVVKDPAVLVNKKDKEKSIVVVEKPNTVVDMPSDMLIVKDMSIVDMPSDISKDKPKNNTPMVVTERHKTELPKDKHKAHLEVLVAKKSIVVSDNFKPNPKQKSKETLVKRKSILSKEDDRKKKGKSKSKKQDSDSELDTDKVDSSFDEVDQKRKKLKIKAESDEESVPKKGKKKLKKMVKKEESNEESVSKKGFSSLHNVTIDKIPSKLGRFVVANFDEQTYMLSLDSGDKIKDIRVNDIDSKLVVAQEVDFLFKVSLITLFTNTMGMSDGLKGHICLDVVRRLCEDFVISDIDWCGYIYDFLQHKKQPNNEILHDKDSKSALSLIKVQFDKFIHSDVLKPFDPYSSSASYDREKVADSRVKVQEVKTSYAISGDKNCSKIVSDKGNDQSLENQSNTSRDESNRSRNECNDKSTSGDETDIIPSYDTKPMVEVPYTAEYNVFAVDTLHSEQSECIINTCVVEKVDSNVIPDLPDMCDNDIQTDQNAKDELPGQMTYLVASLTLDSAKSCVMWSTCSTQGKVSMVPFVLSRGGRISPDSFLPSILLLVVVIVTVVIVAVILIFVVVAIIGVVIVVAIIGVVIVSLIIGVVVVIVDGGGIPSIITFSFMIIGSFSCYWSFTFPGVPIGIVSIFHGSSLCFQSYGNTIIN
nr:hypothetical protein [Tanacetum cinerariifolium]